MTHNSKPNFEAYSVLVIRKVPKRPGSPFSLFLGGRALKNPRQMSHEAIYRYFVDQGAGG